MADAMREAEEIAHQYNQSPQWQKDLTREQNNKRRQALKELVRTNRDPRQEVDSFFPGNIGRPVPPEQLAASRTFRGRDPTGFAPDRRAAPPATWSWYNEGAFSARRYAQKPTHYSKRSA